MTIKMSETTGEDNTGKTEKKREAFVTPLPYSIVRNYASSSTLASPTCDVESIATNDKDVYWTASSGEQHTIVLRLTTPAVLLGYLEVHNRCTTSIELAIAVNDVPNQYITVQNKCSIPLNKLTRYKMGFLPCRYIRIRCLTGRPVSLNQVVPVGTNRSALLTRLQQQGVSVPSCLGTSPEDLLYHYILPYQSCTNDKTWRPTFDYQTEVLRVRDRPLGGPGMGERLGTTPNDNLRATRTLFLDSQGSTHVSKAIPRQAFASTSQALSFFLGETHSSSKRSARLRPGDGNGNQDVQNREQQAAAQRRKEFNRALRKMKRLETWVNDRLNKEPCGGGSLYWLSRTSPADSSPLT